MEDSLPGSSVHGISQARILEWVAIPFSRESSRPKDWTRVSCTVDEFFTIWATREVPVALSKFSLFCNRHQHPSSQFFHLPQLKFYTHETLTPHSSLPRNHHSTSCLHESDYFRDLKQEESHSMCLFMPGLCHLTWISKVYPSCSICQNSSLRGWIIFLPLWSVYVQTTFFPSIHSSANGHLGCFHLWLLQIVLCRDIFISCQLIPTYKWVFQASFRMTKS